MENDKNVGIVLIHGGAGAIPDSNVIPKLKGVRRYYVGSSNCREFGDILAQFQGMRGWGTRASKHQKSSAVDFRGHRLHGGRGRVQHGLRVCPQRGRRGRNGRRDHDRK